MRKIVSYLFISLDGVIEAPDKWQFEHFDADMLVELQNQIGKQDTVLLGRKTYEDWAGYWPSATDEPFASYINNVQKFVISSSLEKADWKNTSVLKGDMAQELMKLKQSPGQDIGTCGSPGLVRYLFENDLLDELILTITPVVAGSGQRLFRDGSELKRLQLLRSKVTETGVIIASYTRCQ